MARSQSASASSYRRRRSDACARSLTTAANRGDLFGTSASASVSVKETRASSKIAPRDRRASASQRGAGFLHRPERCNCARARVGVETQRFFQVLQALVEIVRQTKRVPARRVRRNVPGVLADHGQRRARRAVASTEPSRRAPRRASPPRTRRCGIRRGVRLERAEEVALAQRVSARLQVRGQSSPSARRRSRCPRRPGRASRRRSRARALRHVAHLAQRLGEAQMALDVARVDRDGAAAVLRARLRGADVEPRGSGAP